MTDIARERSIEQDVENDTRQMRERELEEARKKNMEEDELAEEPF